MSLEGLHPGHFVAVVGGAVAGSEAAARLADRGIYVAVFEQHSRPYGKIEDGLPKWHVKLRVQEERKIDERLSRPNVFFVPDTKLGRDVSFYDLVSNWGFSAVLLADGAWKDRPLPVPGIDRFIDKGLVYQNPLITWFNHSHEPDYEGETFEVLDDAMVIGGGLASLDVVKVLMLATVGPALHARGIDVDLLTLEHRTIRKVLEEHDLSLDDLGLKGCTLFYRRRVRDMPLAVLPRDASPEKAEKIYKSREKILNNFQKKFLFRFQECRAPVGFLEEDGQLVGLTFEETEIVDGKVLRKAGTEHAVRSPFVVSSIGSVPEPMPGLRMNGEVLEIRDPATGRVKGHDRLFALGNVVTGKGNIKVSHDHGAKVADHVAEQVLVWTEDDYRKLIEKGAKKGASVSQDILEFIREKDLLTVEQVESIVASIRARQEEVGADGDYGHWMDAHALLLFDEEVSKSEALHEMEVPSKEPAPKKAAPEVAAPKSRRVHS